MVDEPGQIAAFGGVHNGVVVDAEHVAAANALSVVDFLAVVGHRLPYHLAHVLDDKLFGGDLLDRKQAPVVNVRFRKLEWLFSQLFF